MATTEQALAGALFRLLAATDPYRENSERDETGELDARKQAVKALQEAGFGTVTRDVPWIEWDGAGYTADSDPPTLAIVEYELRDGRSGRNWSEGLFWHHDGRGDDIVRYRAIKAED